MRPKPEAIEKIARAIHEDYVRATLTAGNVDADDPSMQPWGSLPDEFKNSSRRQAKTISRRLRLVGYDIVTRDGRHRTALSLSHDIVERLAKMEHTRWMRERLAAGWTHTPYSRSGWKRTNPYLVPWDDLPEEVKKTDRRMVQRIPVLLETVGLRIERVQK